MVGPEQDMTHSTNENKRSEAIRGGSCEGRGGEILKAYFSDSCAYTDGGQIKEKTWIKEWRNISNGDASMHKMKVWEFEN